MGTNRTQPITGGTFFDFTASQAKTQVYPTLSARIGVGEHGTGSTSIPFKEKEEGSRMCWEQGFPFAIQQRPSAGRTGLQRDCVCESLLPSRPYKVRIHRYYPNSRRDALSLNGIGMNPCPTSPATSCFTKRTPSRLAE